MLIYKSQQEIKQIISHQDKLIVLFSNNEVYEIDELEDMKDEKKFKLNKTVNKKLTSAKM